MADKEDRRQKSEESRRYRRPWWERDRRRVAPAVLGGMAAFIPSPTAAAPVELPPPLAGLEPPERDSRAGARPLADVSLFTAPNAAAERQVREWRGTRPEDARTLERIVSQPSATWFGEWNRDVRGDADRLVTAASSQGRVPVLVAYNIPNRDCNKYSAGGLGSPDEYRGWIRELAAGIGDRDAIVVLEPDALALVSCLTPEGQAERFSLIRESVELLKSRTGARIYIDAGHAEWVPPEEIAQRLHLAGIERADGFALNVSNFVSTSVNTDYGERVSARLGGSHFVIDTSRNGGSVAKGEWCNPAGAALGEAPTTNPGHPQLDALLWIKRPGESDGTCNGGPEAGQWWGEYALELASGAADFDRRLADAG